MCDDMTQHNTMYRRIVVFSCNDVDSRTDMREEFGSLTPMEPVGPSVVQICDQSRADVVLMRFLFLLLHHLAFLVSFLVPQDMQISFQ